MDSNTFDLMMRYETEGLDHDDLVALFQNLVDTGLAWRLQGHYGRTAASLVDAGLVSLPSNR